MKNFNSTMYKIKYSWRSREKKSQCSFVLKQFLKKTESLNSQLTTHHYYEKRLYVDIINAHFEIKKQIVKPSDAITIHFLFSSEESCPVWESFFESCLQDVRFAVSVVILDSSSLSNAPSFLQQRIAFLKSKKISVLHYADYDPYKEKPNVLVYQYDDDTFYNIFPKVKCHFVKREGIRPLYIACDERRAAKRLLSPVNQRFFNQSVHLFAWKFFVFSQEMKKKFEKFSLVGSHHLSVLPPEIFSESCNSSAALGKYICDYSFDAMAGESSPKIDRSEFFVGLNT
ncbi:hypothetical protein LJB82_00580 [Desulfovibrio sp. OttesenSCG-928-M16]|nr:hypothetical protein [Desulfovibrio sp. OttesenSCG-928-M16]